MNETLKRYQFFTLYVLGFIFFVVFIYLSIPLFFDYGKSKENIKEQIYKNFQIKIDIKGDIKYRYLPYPHLRIEKVEIKDYFGNKKINSKIKEIKVLIPFTKLKNINKFSFNKLLINKGNFTFDLNNLNSNIKYFINNFKSNPIIISKSKFNFYDRGKIIFFIDNVEFKNQRLKGKFINDEISIQIKEVKKNFKDLKLFIKLKDLGISSVINFKDYKNFDKDLIGNAQINYKTQTITSEFLFNKNFLNLTNTKFANHLFNGQLDGKINIYPFFFFDINMDIDKLNFSRFIKFLKKNNYTKDNNYFKLNNKFNGNLNLDVKKIYSGSKLIKSIESELEFVNGGAKIHKLVMDLGKIGASDITGELLNNDQFSKLIFQQNVYIDKLSKFYNKFRLFNSNGKNTGTLHLSAILNFKTFKLNLIEASGLVADKNKLFDDEYKKFIQRNINLVLLEEGLVSLFNFKKLSEVLKIIQDN
ncbi:MAG: hypothetical protein CBC24_00280 [Candidatus Pelagibacter sp. TMED64]|nr:hypothetical protein [Candidatus Pelagibacter sp.]OUU67908.1 MAG: hypothetical protein CBC24_00280 [Candidatus Pelagibacter sp. TMED64]